MRRLIAAAIIVFAIAGVTLWGNMIITENCAIVEEKIKEIQSTSVEEESKKSLEFYNFWESKRELLSVFVNHNQVDEIGKIAAQMVSAEESKNQTDMFEAANEILYIMRGIKENEQFSLFAIL